MENPDTQVSFSRLAECLAIEGFVETFNGTGPFSSTNGTLDGLDNSGWFFVESGSFRDGGLLVENLGMGNDGENDSLSRTVQWTSGSFVNTVKIREYVLEKSSDLGSTGVKVTHELDDGFLSLSLDAQPSNPELLAGVRAGPVLEFFEVDRGPHMLISMLYDAASSQVTFKHDNDLDDDTLPISLATHRYDGRIDQEHNLFLGVFTLEGRADALIDHWSLSAEETHQYPAISTPMASTTLKT